MAIRFIYELINQIKLAIKLKMTDNESLRHSILKESDLIGSKRRFGLFTHPISTAVCDDGAYKTLVHPKNERGKPVTGPRNCYVSPNKSGQLPNSFFGSINSLTTSVRKDVFLEQGKRLLKEQHETFSKGRKETNFFPTAGIKPITNLAYEFVDEKNPELNPRRFRNEDGKVKASPRNAFTNSQYNVIDTSFKPYKHLDDPYDRYHTIALEHMKRQKAKQHEAAFRPNSFAPCVLSKHREIYGCDIQLSKTALSEIKFNIYAHETAWKSSSPNKHGLYGSLAPFPKYIENPPTERKRSPESKLQKEPFKKMSVALTTPSPSVALNRVNLMRNVNRNISLHH